MIGQKASPEQVATAYPPGGFEPILSNSPFGWENGPFFEKQTDEKWVRGFRVADRHSNVAGMCHGGMLMTFADIVASRAVMDLVSPPFVTVRLNTDFIGPAQLGDWLEGVAVAALAGDNILSISGKIYNAQQVVAAFNGLFKKLGKA